MKCFIFDLDNTPTAVQSTPLVKVLQWKRRCVENYLIDEKIIYDLLNDLGISGGRIGSRGETKQIFKDIAMSQLREVVAAHVYSAKNYENPGLRPREISGKAYDEVAKVLYARLSVMQTQIGGLSEDSWCSKFNEECEAEEQARLGRWETDWELLCDGKRFFRDLHQRFKLKIATLRFKTMIVERMAREQTDSWIVMQKMLSDALRV